MNEVLEYGVDLSSLDELWLGHDLTENIKTLVESIILNNRWMPSDFISASKEIDDFSENNLSWYKEDFVNTFKNRLLDVLWFKKTEVK